MKLEHRLSELLQVYLRSGLSQWTGQTKLQEEAKTFKCWYWVRIQLEIWWYFHLYMFSIRLFKKRVRSCCFFYNGCNLYCLTVKNIEATMFRASDGTNPLTELILTNQQWGLWHAYDNNLAGNSAVLSISKLTIYHYSHLSQRLVSQRSRDQLVYHRKMGYPQMNDIHSWNESQW